MNLCEGYYSDEELIKMGFKTVGDDVKISRKASVYTPEKISIGDHVRVDDFCFLVGNISIGNYVHIAPYASIHGTGGGTVVLKDFTGVSSYSTIYAGSDDYSGKYLTNPTVDNEFKHTIASDIVMEKHSIIGLNSVLLPGAYLAEGTAVGAMSLLKKSTDPWSIYVGSPARKIKDRDQTAKQLEIEFLKNANFE